MDNLDYIDRYFKNELAPEGARQFGDKIESDPAFAEEVAFYLSALEASGEDAEAGKKQWFRELYRQKTGFGNKGMVRKLAYLVAAAAVLAGIVFGLYQFEKPRSRQQMADRYIVDHLQTLPVQMGGRKNNQQTGLQLYNDGKLVEAQAQFERMIQADTTDYTAKEHAGFASLRLREYDKALGYFKQLETYSTLYSNPALFYEALTLMERNHAGDNDKAKQLLEKVVRDGLEGSESAEDWLKRKW